MSVLLILFVIVSMLAVIFIGGWKNLTWEFLTQFPSEGMTKGGIFPAIVGTAIDDTDHDRCSCSFWSYNSGLPCRICIRKISPGQIHPFCR